MLLLLLLHAPQAHAANPVAEAPPVTLSWRFRHGDQPTWAEPGFDDRDWTPISPPAKWPEGAAEGGVAWLRSTVSVHPDRPLAVALGPMRDTWEVYVDGARIGGDGGVPSGDDLGVPRPTGWPIPAEATHDGALTVAVRLWRHPAAAAAFPARSNFGDGPWLVGAPAVVADAVELANHRARRAGLPRFVLFVLYTALGGYHLMLFAQIPKYREYFWFGITALGLAVNVLLVSGWTVELSTQLDPTVRLLTTAFHIQIAAFALFLWPLLERPMGPFVRALVGAHLALSATMLLFGGYPWGLITSFWRGLLLVPLAIAALWVTAIAAWRGNHDARMLLLGGVPLFLAVVRDRLVGIDSMVGGYAAAGFGVFVLSIAGMLASRFARLYAELDERNRVLARINEATSRFVPYPFLEMLGRKSVVEVELGDQVQREMTVVFTDIRAFTTLSENMSARETFAFINDYLSRMEPVVGQHGGFIDKYIGDAIMALFPNRADDAVAAAVGMARALEAFNADALERGRTPIGIGIGINTGTLMLGTVGGRNRMDTTVISDAVNLAARTEGATKRYQTTILLTEDTMAALHDPGAFHLRRIDRISVKGKSQPVTVVEVLDALDPELRDRRLASGESVGRGLDHLVERDLEAARADFQAAADRDPDDPVPRLHLARIDEVVAGGRADDWDGVTQLSEK